MKSSVPFSKDQRERAKDLRQKLRNLKLQFSSIDDCANQHIPNKNSRALVAFTNPQLSPKPLQSPLINNGSPDYTTTSPPKVVDKSSTTLNKSIEMKDNNSGKSLINESISKCHQNIMEKLFSNTEQSSIDSVFHKNNQSSYSEKSSSHPLESNGNLRNPLTVLQSDHKLKYKFNTKYELDYGNNVLRGRHSFTKPLALYNPSLLRSIHRKLSDNSTNQRNSIDGIPTLNEEKIFCLLENGIQTKPHPSRSDSKSLTCEEDVIIVEASNNNSIKSILKKSSDRSIKNITFSIDVQYYDAILNGDLETIKKLAPMMDDFSKKTARGKTPLHLAVESREINVVDYFIEKGLDVNAQDIRGQTPLHVATFNNDLNIIKFLLENGASPFIFSDFLDGFPSMVINEYLPNAINCITVFEEYNKRLGTINNGIVYPICDWAGDLEGDLSLKEMSAVVITDRNDMLLAKKWKAVDKHSKKGFIPWQIITLYPTRNYQNKYKMHNGNSKPKNNTIQQNIITYN